MRKRLIVTMILTILLLTVQSLRAQDGISISAFNDGRLPFSFTSDGQYLVTLRLESDGVTDEEAPLNAFVDVYETTSFSLLATYSIFPESYKFLAISPDARFIAFVSYGGLYVLDRQSGTITQETFNFYEFEAVEFNPVTNLLAYVIGRGITVFDPTDSNVRYELLDNVHGGSITSLAWSPDGRYLANGVYRAGSDTFDVLLWDIPSLQEAIVYEPTFALEGAEPNQIAWRDASTLAAFGETGIMIYDVPSRSLTTFISNPPGVVWFNGDWSPDGTQLVAGGVTRSASVIQIWNVSNLPAYETTYYEEGASGTDMTWLESGLFFRSLDGLQRNGEFLAPELTATAQATASFVPSSTASQPPMATATPLFTASFTPMPTSTPTATLPPTAINAQVAITRIIDAGNITAEGAEIRNNGPVIDLSGWTLRDAEGNAYIFPNGLQLYQGGSLTVFTRVGDDTPIALYWDRQQAAYTSGEAVTLADREGRAQSIATVP